MKTSRLRSIFVGMIVGCCFCIPTTTILSWILDSGPSFDFLPMWGPLLSGLVMGVIVGALVGLTAPFNLSPGKFSESIGGPALLISGIFTCISHLNLILSSRPEKIIISYLAVLALFCLLFLVNNFIGKHLELFRYKEVAD